MALHLFDKKQQAFHFSFYHPPLLLQSSILVTLPTQTHHNYMLQSEEVTLVLLSFVSSLHLPPRRKGYSPTPTTLAAIQEEK